MLRSILFPSLNWPTSQPAPTRHGLNPPLLRRSRPQCRIRGCWLSSGRRHAHFRTIPRCRCSGWTPVGRRPGIARHWNPHRGGCRRYAVSCAGLTPRVLPPSSVPACWDGAVTERPPASPRSARGIIFPGSYLQLPLQNCSFFNRSASSARPSRHRQPESNGLVGLAVASKSVCCLFRRWRLRGEGDSIPPRWRHRGGQASPETDGPPPALQR